MAKDIAITALAPWYGAARLVAKYVGEELVGCNWVGVPFAGGMTELLYLKARTIVASDLHAWVINLARCVADDCSYGRLRRVLESMVFHPRQLKTSQEFFQAWDVDERLAGDTTPDVTAAIHFFICAWMGRNGKAGTDGEFKGGLSVRWDAGGGDSCGRFRSAVRSLAGWRSVLRRCTFQVMDAFEFLGKCQDKPGHGIYCDPPWLGDDYRHKFTAKDWERLAEVLRKFEKACVVVRVGCDPKIDSLFPKAMWVRRNISGRTQTNARKAEWLLINGPSRAATLLFD